jgi:hypothetical protein
LPLYFSRISPSIRKNPINPENLETLSKISCPALLIHTHLDGLCEIKKYFGSLPAITGRETSHFLLPFCHKGDLKNDFLKFFRPQKGEKTAFFSFSVPQVKAKRAFFSLP